MIMNPKTMLLLLALLLCIGIVYADSHPAVNEITINPNPVEKNTLISVDFNQKIQADIIIETLDGVLVKSLYSGNAIVGHYEFFWNRISEDGEFVPAGDYYVTINYYTRYTSTKKTIILK
jgi:hypothetical protein